MTNPLKQVLLLAALVGSVQAAPKADSDPDILRFANGDSLHGLFSGMDSANTLTWDGSSVSNPIVLQTSKLRRLALNGGKAGKSLAQAAGIQLVNGDYIPGRVVDLGESSLTIDTPMAATLTVDRKLVSSISPNPFGGTLHYLGPFTPEGWTILKDAPVEGDQPRVRRAKEKKEEEPAWVFGGDAWYSSDLTPLALDAGIPDKARITFTLAWKTRLSAVIAFHADLTVPELKDEEGNPVAPAPQPGASSYPLTYGRSYVLTIYSSYAMLYRCDFGENGTPVMTRLAGSSVNIRLDEIGEAVFELRCDRASDSIFLFVNGEYVNQWEDPDGYAGTGGHLAFACQNTTSHIRVSDVVVSSWNGMVDSARSMDTEERDTILLTNGTDRFSGHISGIEDGKYLLKGTYADMKIPTTEVDSVRFARATRAELPTPSGKAVRIVFRPAGRITVEPSSATATKMTAAHPAFGDLSLDLGFASLLEFSFTDSILDSWDEDF